MSDFSQTANPAVGGMKKAARGYAMYVFRIG